MINMDTIGVNWDGHVIMTGLGDVKKINKKQNYKENY